MLWTDIKELKVLLEIDPNNTSYDIQLNTYQGWVVNILEELLDRSFDYQARTVVYPGTGTQKLLLRHRPVYPTAAPYQAATQPFTPIQVIIDEGSGWGLAPGAFQASNGAVPLTLGTDYAIRLDLDPIGSGGAGSREAILYRLNDLWPRPIDRQAGELSPFVGPDMGSVQVTYQAGYTIDTLPSALRFAADMLLARIFNLFPLAQQTTSESYIERSIGLSENQKRYLLGLVRPFVFNFRNWHW